MIKAYHCCKLLSCVWPFDCLNERLLFLSLVNNFQPQSLKICRKCFSVVARPFNLQKSATKPDQQHKENFLKMV